MIITFSFKCSCELFDKCIIPVLSYGSEVWGTAVYSSAEEILAKCGRHQLGVGSKAPTPAVLGECGRNTMYVHCYVKCIKYWLKLFKLGEGSLLKSIYSKFVIQCNSGRKSWASDIKNMLYSFGYG